MFRQSRRMVSPAISPLSPVSPRWLDEDEQASFIAEPDELSDFSEKTFIVPTLVAEPRRRDVRWSRKLRDIISELRSVFAAQSIGIPVDRLGLCLRPVEDTDFDAYDDAGTEITLLSEQPVQPRLCWFKDRWVCEASAIIFKLLSVLAQKRIGMDVNSFLDFIGLNNNKKPSYESELSGRLDKVRNRLLCKRDSPDLIHHSVFYGLVPLDAPPNQAATR